MLSRRWRLSMRLKVRDVMTGIPVMLRPDQTLADAACAMRDHAVGCVLVATGRHIRGVITDRDIVVRAIAESRDPAKVQLRDVCSVDLAVIAPDDDVADALLAMRRRAVRRLPVVEGRRDRKSTRLNSSHPSISYAVFCLK